MTLKRKIGWNLEPLKFPVGIAFADLVDAPLLAILYSVHHYILRVVEALHRIGGFPGGPFLHVHQELIIRRPAERRNDLLPIEQDTLGLATRIRQHELIFPRSVRDPLPVKRPAYISSVHLSRRAMC